MKAIQMGIFIGAVILMVGVANMAFQQGQANPEAKSFFQSDASRR